MKATFVLCKSAMALLVVLTIFTTAKAQAPAWLWAHNAGENVYEEICGVAADAHGNILAGGYYNTWIYNLPHSNGPDAFLVKYNPAGNVTWTTAISDTGRERVLHVAFDKLGHYYIMGVFDGHKLHFYNQTFTNAEYNALDIFIAKFDTAHNFIWAKHVGGPGETTPTGMAVDSIGNCYITGWYNGTKIGFDADTIVNSSNNFADLFVAKYAPNGNFLWAKSATGDGSGSDKSESIAIDKLGNCYITGDFNSNSLSFDGTVINKMSNFNMFIAKYSSNGTILWAKRSKSTGDSHGYSVAVDPQMNCYVTGSFKNNITLGATTLTSSGNEDIFIAKYAADSTVLWAKSATGGSSLDEGSKLSTDALGYCYATGYFESDSIRFGSWNLINNGSGFQDIYLAVYDPYGNVQWAKSIGGSHNDFPNCITVDPARNSIIGGWLGSDSIVIGSQILYSAGSSDALIAKSANTAPSAIAENDHTNAILVYPNPANDYINVQLPGDALISILNLQGQLCKQVKSPEGLARISVYDLSSGVYILKLVGSNINFTGKLIRN
jgi:hypothetical protein